MIGDGLLTAIPVSQAESSAQLRPRIILVALSTVMIIISMLLVCGACII